MKVYTIKDIAAMAGVSVTTVSRVLNHRPDVNEATRKKVEQIIRDCHFIGNTNARGLKQGSEVIGVVVRGRSNPFLGPLLRRSLRGPIRSRIPLSQNISMKRRMSFALPSG